MICSLKYVRRSSLFVAALWLLAGKICQAQKAPEIGYVYPPGGRPGTTVEVRLGGYDWTPDMQLFTHDARVQLKATAPPGELLISPPPYWFGPKGKFPPFLVPRETPATFTIPADMPAGIIEWQAANANGSSSVGTFMVSTLPEILEEPHRRGPQEIPSIPVTINGRIAKVEEVDRYRFLVPQAGLVTCELFARRLGSKLHGVFEVRNAQGQVVADAADTEARDASISFTAEAGAPYTLSLHDVDFGGDFAFIYRLQLTMGPRVVAAIPAAGRRGETRDVEFLGWGLATGAAQIESVTKPVTFPADAAATSLAYSLATPAGGLPAFPLLVTNLPESVEPAAAHAPQPLAIPSGITGTLARSTEEDRYVCTGKMGDVWEIECKAREIGSPLDVMLAVNGPDGKEVARNDDLPGTTDAALTFKVPADGSYTVIVADISGKSVARTSTYHLTIESGAGDNSVVDFALDAPRLFNVLIDGKGELVLKVRRKGTSKDPILVSVEGLPAGVTVAPDLQIPADKPELKVPFTVAPDAATTAAIIKLKGTQVSPAGNIVRETRPILLATTMKPRAKVSPVDRDGARTVHRGTTYPAEVIVTRMEGFEGEVILHEASIQSYQCQGMHGWDVVVPPGVSRTHYMCFMPEWMELDRTSRMVLVAECKVADPKGTIRHLVSPMDGRITMLLEGALLKVSQGTRELVAKPGSPLEIPVKISRSPKLPQPVKLELVVPVGMEGLFKADSITVPPGQTEVVFRVETMVDARLLGNQSFTIKGTAYESALRPVISQAEVPVEFVAK